MTLPENKWPEIFPNVWDMGYNEKTDCLKVFLGGGEPVGFFGDQAQKFYDAYKKYCSQKNDPSERVTPLEVVNEDGLYDYEIERKNVRKMMNIKELAQDDIYHGSGHLFLDSVVGMQHASQKYLKVLQARRKKFGEQMQNLQKVLMKKEYSANDFKLFEKMVLTIKKQEMLMKEMDEVTLELLERFGPA